MSEPKRAANTRLAGHTLLRVGKSYYIDGCGDGCQPGKRDLYYGGVHAADWAGHARCSCGDASPCLDTDRARKQWHREHKEHVRALIDTKGSD